MISNKNYREITIPSIILGIILGILMTASFVYAGLKLGFTIGGSAVASILGFVILKGILRKGTIIENNINQTIASSINVSSAGIIFTVPALLLMGRDFNLTSMFLVVTAGSILGIVMIIPLRKQMIEIEKLRFPTGTAVATILKSPGAGPKRAILLLSGTVISALTVIAIKYQVIPDRIPLGRWLSLPDYMSTAIALSLMNFGAGMLAGRGGLPFALGGIIAYWFLSPIAVQGGWIPATVGPGEVPGYLFSSLLRPTGIGMLIGGAVMGVVVAFPAIRSAFSGLLKARETQRGESGLIRNELNLRTLGILTFLGIATIFSVTYFIENLGFGQSILLTMAGTLWIAVAGLIVAQCTGLTDVSPLSGLSLIGITIILLISGGNVLIAVIIGAAICVASGQCADMMQDLKTGHLVGSIPRKQQIIQFAFSWIGPLVAIGTMYLLWQTDSGAPGFGPASSACIEGAAECLSAPQADALRVMVEGIVSGNIPVGKYIAGGIIGAVMTILPTSGLGVLIGLAMYLPFYITLGFGIGCIITMAITKLKGHPFSEEYLVPFAAGLIIGEALSELVYSLYRIIV